jgi:transposase/uncharacterized coiled-coil protein SlyX
MEYKDTIRQLNSTITAQSELILSLKEMLSASNTATANLQEQVAYLTRKLFGTSSESRHELVGQLSLFDEAEQEASTPVMERTEEGTTVHEHTRKSKSKSEEIFKGVPVKEEVIELPEEEQVCVTCNVPLERIGKEFVRQEFCFTPAKGTLKRIYRATYKCPECTTSDTLAANIQFVKAPVPDALIPHSYASSSAVSYVMYQKYVNSMPLYRQEQDWKQIGVKFSRATLANWIIFCANEYLHPLYDYFHHKLLERSFLMADETRIQVLKETGRSAESDSYMWLFRSGEDGLPPIILYWYTQTRAKYNAEAILSGFEGYLETDGYQGYNNLPGIKRCCCWSHTRRYFIEAVPKGKEYDYSNPAVQGVQFISKLFEYERISKEKKHTHEQRKAYRMQKEKPVLDAFWSWLDSQRPRKGSRFDKAVNYAQNRKAYLETYLEDGRCSFTNNLSENSIRPFTVGRKNWLFSDSPKGATASAIVYTIVEMAKANELNIYNYLNYLLAHRPSIDMTDEQLERLAPWSKDVKDSCENVK